MQSGVSPTEAFDIPFSPELHVLFYDQHVKTSLFFSLSALDTTRKNNCHRFFVTNSENRLEHHIKPLESGCWGNTCPSCTTLSLPVCSLLLPNLLFFSVLKFSESFILAEIFKQDLNTPCPLNCQLCWLFLESIVDVSSHSIFVAQHLDTMEFISLIICSYNCIIKCIPDWESKLREKNGETLEH